MDILITICIFFIFHGIFRFIKILTSMVLLLLPKSVSKSSIQQFITTCYNTKINCLHATKQKQAFVMNGMLYSVGGANYSDDFSKPKIIFQEMVQEPSFVFDSEKHFFCLDTGRIITGLNLEYLVGVLNSKLFFFSIKNYYGGGTLGDKGVRMKHTFFENYPALVPDEKTLATITEAYQSQNYSYFDKVISSYMYLEYGLTEEEIKYIECT